MQNGYGDHRHTVGILAIEVCFPKLYIEQTDLEAHDGCLGKYTKSMMINY